MKKQCAGCRKEFSILNGDWWISDLYTGVCRECTKKGVRVEKEQMKKQEQKTLTQKYEYFLAMVQVFCVIVIISPPLGILMLWNEYFSIMLENAPKIVLLIFFSYVSSTIVLIGIIIIISFLQELDKLKSDKVE